ncbi:MAG: hypothetical protein EPN99_01630 [Frankiales bacterium]|nr:MAG: hypothetical protein EPN99_01630 [Frankiales bacterium]
MTTSRSGLRRAVTGALVLPLTGLVLVATALAASAAVTAPGNGTVFTSYSSFTISADYGRSTSENRLTLTSPSGSTTTIATAPANLSGGTLSWTMDTGCFTSSGGCVPAPNGTWTVTQSGGGTGTSTFVTRIAPKAPQSVTASEVSPREARVSWRKGDEPDLTGWQVVEGDTVVKDGIGRSACEGSTCSAVITYAVDGSGAHTYAVRALRSTAPGSSSTIESPLSSPASVTLSAPAPSPEPASGGSTGGGASGGDTDPGTTPSDGASGDPSGGSGGSAGGGTGSGGTGSPGSGGGTTSGGGGGTAAPIGSGTSSSGETADAKAVAQRKAFALGFSSFGPKLGIPKLPPLPQQAPAIAPELADGTYEPTLGFEDQIVTEEVEATGPTAAVRNVVGSALDSERLATSTAGALLLLLAGAHLRRWLGATSEEP